MTGVSSDDVRNINVDSRHVLISVENNDENKLPFANTNDKRMFYKVIANGLNTCEVKLLSLGIDFLNEL